jgi:hypothetical protein
MAKGMTADEVVKAEKLSAQGLSQEQIAYSLGWAASTLYKRKLESTELAEAIKRGKVSGIEKVTNALFDKAMDGDNVAMIFWLKNRDKENWRDKHDFDVKSEDTSKSNREMLEAQLRAAGIDPDSL